MAISSNAESDHIRKLFNVEKAVIGVVHCPAFPGAPRYDGRSVDDLIGEIVDELDRLQVLNNTYILVSSDHGPVTRFALHCTAVDWILIAA